MPSNAPGRGKEGAGRGALRLATPDQDGKVSREKVYTLGGYADDRMLEGFTRPFRRLTAELQAEGAIPAGVSQIFVARYPDGVRASYFSAPSEVPQLLEELSFGPSRGARELDHGKYAATLDEASASSQLLASSS